MVRRNGSWMIVNWSHAATIWAVTIMTRICESSAVVGMLISTIYFGIAG